MLEWVPAETITDVGGGVHRHHNPLAHGPTPPFPAYREEPTGEPDGAPGDVVPDFAVRAGTALVRIGAAASTDRYGLGEVCGSLRHTNRRVTGATHDAFAYDDRADGLYQAHPWVLCVRDDGSAFGVIVETTWRYTAHLRDHLLFEVDGPPPAVTVIDGDDPAAVVRTLGGLTGPMPLPPRWALGYHQSRWSYAPAEEVVALARRARAHRLPADVIWIDIDHMDGFRVFTFDPEGFPDPAGLVDELHQLGWRSAWMVDPGIKVEDGYRIYDEARAEGHLLTDASGDELHGVVWPGRSAWPDFTRRRTREWWAGLYPEFLAHGIDAVWNDMNEPANLEDVPDRTLPANAWHRADEALGGPDVHARYRNVYGMLMTEASRAGMEAARPDARPFLLTRSTFLGGQRHAATWTGDNVSTWEHLAWSIPMVLNLGLSGQPLAGPDIGGFAGRCDGALLARWMGIGCLFPFARNHAMRGTPAQEPWAFGEQVEATCRRALERRYRLLPYLYTLAREASVSGAPIARPAFFADPSDRSLRAVDTAFLLGDDLYIRCDVTRAGAGPVAPVPVGWRRVHLLDDPVEAKDRDLPELYLRPGAILPLGPVMQWSDERPIDPLTLLVHPGGDGRATGTLYEDDGDGHDHRDRGYRVTGFDIVDGAVHTTVVEGDWSEASWETEVVWIGGGPDRR